MRLNRSIAPLFLLTCVLLWVHPGTADAQHHRGLGFLGGFGGGNLGYANALGFGPGFGLGYGIGFGNFNYLPNQVLYVNQQSLQNGAHATMGPVERRGYAEAPAAYYNHVHEAGVMERYNVGARRELEARVGRFSDGPPPSHIRRERLAKLVKENEGKQRDHHQATSVPFPSPQLPIIAPTTLKSQVSTGSPPSTSKSTHISEPSHADARAK